ATPTLGVSDEASHRHRALEQHREFFAFLHVFPVTGSGATDFFIGIQFVSFTQLFFCIATRTTAARFCVFGAFLAGVIALSTETPAIGLCYLVAVLVEEVDVVDLLNGATGEAGLVGNE